MSTSGDLLGGGGLGGCTRLEQGCWDTRVFRQGWNCLQAFLGQAILGSLYLLIRVLAQLDLPCHCPWCPGLFCPSWQDAERTGTCAPLVKQVLRPSGVTREVTTLPAGSVLPEPMRQTGWKPRKQLPDSFAQDFAVGPELVSGVYVWGGAQMHRKAAKAKLCHCQWGWLVAVCV